LTNVPKRDPFVTKHESVALFDDLGMFTRDVRPGQLISLSALRPIAVVVLQS